MSYRDRKEIQIKLEFPTWDSLSEENKQLLQSKISKGFDLYSDFFDDNEVITLDFLDYEAGYGFLCFNCPETDYYLYVNFTTINTQLGIGTWYELEGVVCVISTIVVCFSYIAYLCSIQFACNIFGICTALNRNF